MANTGYSVTIKECSRELSARERIMLKDTSNAIKLDEVITDDTPFNFKPIDYAVLAVHNDKAQGDKDYEQYLILSEDGNKYVTGSHSFWNAFKDIWDEMHASADSEEYSIDVYKMDSKNYKGKKFITCSIV